MEMFAECRREAVSNNEIEIEDHRYMFPDRKYNVMSVYRQESGIDYSESNSFNAAETCFFPGCTLMTYSPALTIETFKRLRSSSDCQEMWTECCGKPLNQLGFQKRLKNMQRDLKQFVKDHHIKRLITACPGCYYELRGIFKSDELKIQTVYEVLTADDLAQNRDSRFTIHDSCPDRSEGIFGRHVRMALEQQNCTISEMKHNGQSTVCCGSGGQQSHFRPDLAEETLQMRQDEVQQTAAHTLVGYCMSCVLKYDGKMPGVSVVHALSLLLDVEVDYKGAKERAAKILSGPRGEQLWDKIMAE
jgi:fumarate reductase (CoM/CoB) subunit B